MKIMLSMWHMNTFAPNVPRLFSIHIFAIVLEHFQDRQKPGDFVTKL